MSFLYLTADQVGLQSGGGRVTQEESTALHDLGVERGEECTIWGRDELGCDGAEPWKWDRCAYGRTWEGFYRQDPWPKLAHVYAGTFTNTVKHLGRNGCKVAYTAAAHNVDKSRREHLKLGLPFDYPHLTDPQLWDPYVGGYRAADVVVCPSQHSADCMRSYGCQRVEVIPHGVDIPEETKPLPDQFRVGYLGSCGSPDKGVVYLLQAWKKLNYPDATLILAGRDSTSDWVKHLVNTFGGGRIGLAGWQQSTSDFYNNISMYVQPSITEGFGIEILEAMAHGRFALCSTGAGGTDVVPETWSFPAGDADALAGKIDGVRRGADLKLMGAVARGLSKDYTWESIRQRYQQMWRSLLE